MKGGHPPRTLREWENAMAFQPFTNGIEVVIHASVAGQSVINTFHAHKGSAVSGTDAIVMAANCDDAWATNMLPILSQGYVYEYTSVRGLTSPTDVYAEDSTSAGIGAVTVDPLPNNVALSVKRFGDLTGRAARGRVYIGGIPETDFEVAGQTVTSAFVDALVDALMEFHDVLSDGTFTEVTVHRSSGGVFLEAAVGYVVTTYAVVDRVVDSQRRRLPGRGV